MNTSVLHVFLIDNFDSFTYNLQETFSQLGAKVSVFRNNVDFLYIQQCLENEHGPKLIAISPGPGAPESSGLCHQLLKQYECDIPFLGICLGHQIIAQYYKAEVKRSKRPKHGQSDLMHHKEQGPFTGLPNPLIVARYHSLQVASLSRPLKALSHVGDTLMAFQHEHYPIFGLQFHPESILTPNGQKILSNIFQFILEKTGEPS